MPSSSQNTPTPQAPEREAEIRARRDAITDAPWGSYRDLDGRYTVQAGAYITPTEGFASSGDVAHIDGDTDAQRHHRAEFIAYAPRDIDDLLTALDAERERSEKRRRRMAAAEGDLLDIRGLLAPSGAPCRVPMELGERVAPAVEWLLAEVVRLRAQVAELERQTAAVTEYRVGAPTGLSLYVRRAPDRDGWAVFEARTAREGRRAWTPDGWQILALLAHSEMHCWPDDVTALAEARKALATEGGAR